MLLSWRNERSTTLECDTQAIEMLHFTFVYYKVRCMRAVLLAHGSFDLMS